jgi:hypothetical protein
MDNLSSKLFAMLSRAQLRLLFVALFTVFLGGETPAAGQTIARSAQVTLIARMPDDVTMLLPSATVDSFASSATPRSPLQFDFVGHLLPGASVSAACSAQSAAITMRSEPRNSRALLPVQREFACDGRFRSLPPGWPRGPIIELSLDGLAIHHRAVERRLDITLSVI